MKASSKTLMARRPAKAKRATRSRADRLAAMEARLAELEAKEQIRELFSVYGFAADTGDDRRWSEVWDEDAVYDRGTFGVRQGRPAFFKSISNPDGAHKQQIEGKGSLHSTGPLMIRVKKDRAWAEGPSQVWVKDGDSYRMFTFSYNHWDLRRRGGRWYIAKRVARSVSPGLASQAFTAWSAEVPLLEGTE